MAVGDVILELLQAKGIACDQAFPNGRMPVLEAPMVMVGTKQILVSPCAIDNHFGLLGDEVCRAALCREETLVQIYSPYLWGGQYCDKTTDSVLSLILGNTVDFTVKSILRGQSYYDAHTDCFRNEIVVTTQAWVQLPEE